MGLQIDKYANETIGVSNISVNGSASELSLQTIESEVGKLFASQLGGSVQYASVAVLALFGYFMFKSDVSEDVTAAVMVPTTFLMASEGLLPFGEGIFFGMILAAAGVFIFTIIKFADN